jgi:hypothetical protein
MADNHTQETAITNYTIAIVSTQILNLIKMTNNTTDRFKILARTFKIDNRQTRSKRDITSLTWAPNQVKTWKSTIRTQTIISEKTGKKARVNSRLMSHSVTQIHNNNIVKITTSNLEIRTTGRDMEQWMILITEEITMTTDLSITISTCFQRAMTIFIESLWMVWFLWGRIFSRVLSSYCH